MFTESSPTTPAIAHLDPDAARLLTATLEEKRAHIQKDEFIEHQLAKVVLRQLQRAYDAPVESVDRLKCLALIAESGSGKTATIKTFQRRIWDKAPETPGFAPILIVEGPAPADAQGLHLAIAKELRCPFSRSLNPKQIAIHVQESLRNFRTRMLVVDEAHNMDPLDDAALRVALDSLKNLANSLHVVLVGTITLENILMRSDEQITSRFRIIRLGRFTFDDHYRDFLAALARRYPLPKPSDLDGDEFAEKIFRVTEGVIGEIVTLCGAAAMQACEDNKPCIDMDALTTNEYIPRPVRK